MTRPIDPSMREDASGIAAEALDLPGPIDSEDPMNSDGSPELPAADGAAAMLHPAVPAHALNPYAPGDEENLAAGIALSTVVHIAIAGLVVVYGFSLIAQPDLAPSRKAPDSNQSQAVRIDLNSLLALTKAPETEPGDGGVVEQPKPEPEPEPEVAKVEEPPPAVEPPPEPPKRAPRIKRSRKAVVARKAAPAPTSAPETIAPAVADAASPASTQAVEPAGEPRTEPVASPQIAVTPRSVTPAPRGGSGGGQASSIDRKGMLKGYMKQLSRAVRKNYKYPRAAERAGLEGKVLVSITLDASGKIIAVKLARSSGHEILDKAALDAARSVGSLPPAPDALGWGQRSVKIPFRFKAS